MIRLLFICHGNICRSPMAEFIMKALVKAKGLEDDFYIESAAVSDEESGNPIYSPTKRCLNLHGVWFDPNKTARTVTPQDYYKFDRLICMDSSNINYLKRIIPTDPDNKIHLLLSYTSNCRDVDDPWYSGDQEQAFQDILEGCISLLKSLNLNRM